jgi:hypothetical protein
MDVVGVVALAFGAIMEDDLEVLKGEGAKGKDSERLATPQRCQSRF